MKVVFTASALADLDDIQAFLASHYPDVMGMVDARLRVVVARIGHWPRSAQSVPQRPGVYVVPLVRYPYKIFYKVAGETVEILHIHHTSRRPWEETS